MVKRGHGDTDVPTFPPFRLDLSNEQLWRDTQVIELRPKTFAVLRYLVEHEGRLVTKDELLDAVWGQTIVSDTVLKSCIRELRTVLGDEVQSPRYIATVHRRGYRFIAPLCTTTQPVRSPESGVRSPQSPAPSTQHLAPTLVGRESELAQLHGWLEKALRGERQIVFVTGEPGIGKTTLVEAFLIGIGGQGLGAGSFPPQQPIPNPQPPTPSPWIGRGQCIEQYGAGEAYLPILEALGRLCREPGGERLMALLNQHAPTWLVQMPTLLTATELETLQRKVAGATRERMLREMVEAVDALTAEKPLVLWLEDLHWSDPSTLELLALLARRRERARLLVIGTYRPVDVIVREHPLRAVKQELQLHDYCQELSLRLLTEAAVGKYLAVRFDVEAGARRAVPLRQLAHVIHERTEGNPLFMVTVVENLVIQGALVQDEGHWVFSGAAEKVTVSIPENLRQMIERQMEQVSSADRKLLEAASVAGVEFSVVEVAAMLEADPVEVEEHCEECARQQRMLRPAGLSEWPDGTLAPRYRFQHVVYQSLWQYP